jgi:hypothetical protein
LSSSISRREASRAGNAHVIVGHDHIALRGSASLLEPRAIQVRQGSEPTLP